MSVPRVSYQVRVHRRVCNCLLHGIGQGHTSCAHHKGIYENITYNIMLFYVHIYAIMKALHIMVFCLYNPGGQYDIIMFAYITLEARLLHIFLQRWAEALYHFIKGGPPGSKEAHLFAV